MAKSKIEWTDMVWNPVVGCSRVSEGCRHCYAERMARRLVAMGMHAYDGTVVDAYGWTGQVNEVPEALGKPSHWKKPQLVFVNSMSDLFHPSVRVAYIANVWAVMGIEDRHTYMVLTKRADRMNEILNSQEFKNEYRDCVRILTDNTFTGLDLPLDNVWLGVSVETDIQRKRIDYLMGTPAARRFVSVEPMLSSVDLSEYLRWGNPPLDWVICGGESGPGARPMHPDWARILRDQCKHANVPFFFKGWGNWWPVYPQYGNTDSMDRFEDEHPNAQYEAQHEICLENSGSTPQEWDRDVSIFKGWQPKPELNPWWMHEIGKKASGRLLDGREWNEMPDLRR